MSATARHGTSRPLPSIMQLLASQNDFLAKIQPLFIAQKYFGQQILFFLQLLFINNTLPLLFYQQYFTTGLHRSQLIQDNLHTQTNRVLGYFSTLRANTWCIISWKIIIGLHRSQLLQHNLHKQTNRVLGYFSTLPSKYLVHNFKENFQLSYEKGGLHLAKKKKKQTITKITTPKQATMQNTSKQKQYHPVCERAEAPPSTIISAPVTQFEPYPAKNNIGPMMSVAVPNLAAGITLINLCRLCSATMIGLTNVCPM
eukprot:TRINITY_DN15616_c0_g1_i14.p2 TRINITY_DN15616_c0_g1~~TRINITY_DN15616_c0_g1_i14.p2  ORF type:complete len:256 (+),score=7.52 TRINITY_DN15616_c0_g1_i14:622-1389(+)